VNRLVHVFDNGVQVYDDHLLSSQRERYKRRNVHEAEEEDTFLEILRSLPPDGCFLNIGSAIGYYPLLAKRIVPGLVVHAVEPLELHRQQFLENIALNGLNHWDFTIHDEAISSSVGRARFLEDGYSSGIDRGTTRTESQRVLEIRTTTLDRLVERIGRHVDLCQMDVQGHELDVLEGSRRALESGGITTFLIGTHSPRLHRRCTAVLTDHGYEILHDLYETQEQPDGILSAIRLTAPPD
jgi:FkbM family methyltransferase